MASSYKHRLVDVVLKEYLDELPAICIDGAKGVGKTSAAQQVSDARFLKLRRAALKFRVGTSRGFDQHTAKGDFKKVSST